MTRKESLEFLSRFAYCVRRAGQSTMRDRDVSALEDTIRAQEKEHRAFGRRLVGAAEVAKGRLTIGQATDYFLARTIANAVIKGGDDPGARPMRDMVGVRSDYVRAAIIVADPDFFRMLASEVARVFGAHLLEVCKRVYGGLDYSELVK